MISFRNASPKTFIIQPLLGCYVLKKTVTAVAVSRKDENGITYYQVAATVRDENTLKRELASLQQISDQYPKYILTLDEDPTADYNGIKRVNALKWMMESV